MKELKFFDKYKTKGPAYEFNDHMYYVFENGYTISVIRPLVFKNHDDQMNLRPSWKILEFALLKENFESVLDLSEIGLESGTYTYRFREDINDVFLEALNAAYELEEINFE